MSDTESASGDMPDAAPGVVAPAPASGFARRALLRRLMDVVALPSSRGNIQDRAIAGDLLLEILIESDVTARELCAKRLQEMSQAPKRLLRFLALDAPHVAQIILSDNKAFDDADLAYVIHHGGTAHRTAVARRRDVGASVASAIADSGDTIAMKVLLENAQAKLSDRSVEMMVAASRRAPELCPLLIQREELRPAHALAMFWWSKATERRQILLRFSAERTLLIDGCAEIFKYEGVNDDPLVRKALQIIERRQRNRGALVLSEHENLETAINAAAVTGLDTAMMEDISRLSGVKPTTGERIFLDKGGEGLAVLCKATGLKRQFLRELWIGLGRGDGENDADFRRVADVYESIAVAKAQTVLRYWNWSLRAAFSPDGAEEADDAMFARDVVDIDDVAPTRARYASQV